MSKKKADELRTSREITISFIKKCGSIERAADVILSSPGRSQHAADIRETTIQGVGLPDEDALNIAYDTCAHMEFTDYRNDHLCQFILLEDMAAESKLPRIAGKLGRIVELAGMGKSAQQIADDRYVRLSKRRINQVLQNKDGKLLGKVEAARRQLESPL